jgi:NTE family protein/lysophospholipid hydrolase
MVSRTTPNTRVVEVLRKSSVFGQLDDVELSELVKFLEFRHVEGGSQILNEGDVSDSVLFVISGCLRVSRRDETGKLCLYNEIRPGESVGEVGMILRQTRTANVTAVRDSTLAVLNQGHFEALLKIHPISMNRVFLQAVYNQFRHVTPPAERPDAQTFAVIPLHAGTHASDVVQGMVHAFSKLGRVHRLCMTDDPARADGGSGTETYNVQHDLLESRFEFLIYETSADPTAWTLHALRQADQVVFVAASDRQPDTVRMEARLQDAPGFSMKRKHLVVLHGARTEAPQSMPTWRTQPWFERIYPLRQHHVGDFARLARFLTNTAVGVVLGGGGARGFAHLGVLRALEEAGVPIDLIGGNSMGALIGAQVACGVPLEQIRVATQAFALGGERLTLPLISLVSGRRVERDLKRMFGDAHADGLWRPFFAAACNLSKGCTTVQDSGPLWRAVLASNSPAGLFPPVLLNGDLLVDGAILENVPVEGMRMRLGTALEKRRGNGTVIAIDVDVREDLTVDPSLTRLSIWNTFKGHLGANRRATPGIASILYRAGHMGGASQRARAIAQADHYLEPPVASFPLMGYNQADQIVEVGYRYAVKRIQQWSDQASAPPQARS